MLSLMMSNIKIKCSVLHPASYLASPGHIKTLCITGFGSCIHNPQNDIDYCELVPEEAHYCMVLLCQQYGLMLVNSYIT